MSSPLKSPSIIVPCVAFVSSLTLFLCTLQRTIFLADSTEFITAVGSFGVAHPPGYPLFLLLGHLVSFIPLGTLAIKMNLLAALCGAGTVALVTVLIYKITKNAIASLFGAGILTTTASFWLYSLTAEVFTLNTFLISLFTIAIFQLFESPTKKTALIAIGIFSLNIGNHHTATLLAPALLFALYYLRNRIEINPFFILCAGLISLLGFLPYLLIYFSALKQPVLNWDNPISISQFIHLLLRKDYGSLSLAPNALSFTSHSNTVTLFFTQLWYDSFGFLVFFGALGFYWLFKYGSKIHTYFISYSFLALGPLFAIISHTPITSIAQQSAFERFSIASNFFLALASGIGAHFLLSKLPARFDRIKPITLILLLIPLLLNYEHIHQQNNNLYYTYSKEILNQLPPNAIFLSSGDTSEYGTRYLQLIEHLRPDIRIIAFPKLFSKWYPPQIRQQFPDIASSISDDALTTLKTLCERFGSKGILFMGSWSSGLSALQDTCNPFPTKLVVQLQGTSPSPPLLTYSTNELSYFTHYLETIPKVRLDGRTERLRYEISNQLDEIGSYLYSHGDTKQARIFYEYALATSPFWSQSEDMLAVINYSEGKDDDAIANLREGIRRNPNYPWTYFRLGVLLFEKGNKKEAQNMLHTFMTFKPDPARAETQRAQLLLRELDRSG